MTSAEKGSRQAWLATRVAAAGPISDGAVCLADGIPVDPESVSRAIAAALAELHTIDADDFPFHATSVEGHLARARERIEHDLVEAADGPYRGISPSRLMEILDDQMAALPGGAMPAIVHGALTASAIWFHPESGVALARWDGAGVGDPHLDLALAVKLLGDTYGFAIAAPFFDTYGVEQIDALRLDAFQLLVHMLTG